jgi:hypothetical protein
MDGIDKLADGAQKALQCVAERCQSELIRVVLELGSCSDYGSVHHVEKALDNWIEENKEALSALSHQDQLDLVVKLAQAK